MQGLRKLDIFPKFDSRFETEAREKTAFGALLSVASLLIALILAIGELQYFLSVENRHELYVDNTELTNRLDIKINVTFLNVPCDLISIDAIDSFGEFQKDLEKTTVKTRISKEGEMLGPAGALVNTGKKETVTNDERNPDGTKKCLSCYGAELFPGQCCNTCDDVHQAYERRQWTLDVNDVSIVQCAKERLALATARASHEGCNIAASMNVKRVQGNIHFIPGRAFQHLGQHLHDISSPEMKNINLSHVFHRLDFGEHYPGLVNPLDGQTRISHLPENVKAASDKLTPGLGGHQAMPGLMGVDDSVGTAFGGGKYQYFVKVVPTRFERLSGERLNTNQYSVTEHFAPLKTDPNFVPGMFIIYDLSPLVIHIFEARPYASVAHFVLELCAIVGGVFTVAGLLDAVLHHGAKQVKRKMQIGKLS